MKKETLKDWVKGWSVKTIVGQIGAAGMQFMADQAAECHSEAGLEEYQETKRILTAELNRRIRNAKKL